jgi:hypothetical protein
VSVPVVLDTPRDLTDRQERKLRLLDADDAGAVIVGWDDHFAGPIFRLPAFPGGRYVIDPRGEVRDR